MLKTRQNLNREGSKSEGHSNLGSKSLSNGGTIELTDNNLTPSARESRKESEIILLKDRDWRGEKNSGMWWECLWEGMDGFRGSTLKGKRCFDRVRISWQNLNQD